MQASISNIQGMLARFVSGERAVRLAGEVEVAIDRAFPDDPEWQDGVQALASYRPGGGEFLFDDAQISHLLERASARLKSGG